MYYICHTSCINVQVIWSLQPHVREKIMMLSLVVASFKCNKALCWGDVLITLWCCFVLGA